MRVPMANAHMMADRPSFARLVGRMKFSPPPDKVVGAIELLSASKSRSEPKRLLTASDLTVKAGLSLQEAQSGLNQLATALAGEPGVAVCASDRGEILYSFPADVRQRLRARSSSAKVRDTWLAAKPTLEAAGRVAFGVALFASIAVVGAAIAALLASSSSSSDDRDRNRRSSGSGFGDFGRPNGAFLFGDSVYYGGYGPSPLDFLFPRPFGFYSYGWFEPPPRMSLPEAIFSFVFGDGDANSALPAARVRAIANVIRGNGGAVVADQLAPFLDPPRALPGEGSAAVDESWVLPAVLDLGGRPEVSDDGTIVYIFDELLVSSMASDADLILADPALANLEDLNQDELARLAEPRGIGGRGVGMLSSQQLRSKLRAWASERLQGDAAGGLLSSTGLLQERRQVFSNADGGQLFAAAALGALNFAGVAFLGSLLSSLPVGTYLPGWLGATAAVYPALVAYAASFVALPAIRFARLGKANQAIDARNNARRVWRDALIAGDPELTRRRRAAMNQTRKLRRVGRADVAFDSSQPAGEFSAAQPKSSNGSPALDDFDNRLSAKAGPRGGP